MKILAISGEKLASLDHFEVRFDRGPLGGSGLFVICGPTGAGKSTLLDAMCLALYDRTPRLGPGKGPLGLLPRSAVHAAAAVEFCDQKGQRYRASWQIHRARRRQAGEWQEAQIELISLDSGESLGSHRKRDTLELIERKIGLGFEQFCRSVLLAQGEFARFLHETGDDRARLLEAITGGEIYTELSKQAFLANKAAAELVDKTQQRLASLKHLDVEQRLLLQREEQMLIARKEALERGEQAATARQAWEKELLERRREVEQAELAVQRAQESWRKAEPLRKELLLWTRAEEVRPALAERARSETALQQVEKAMAAGSVELLQKAQVEHEAQVVVRAACQAESAKVEQDLEQLDADLRLAHASADLIARRAELLQPNHPCPLCGSLEHPKAGIFSDAEEHALLPRLKAQREQLSTKKRQLQERERAAVKAEQQTAERRAALEAAAKKARELAEERLSEARADRQAAVEALAEALAAAEFTDEDEEMLARLLAVPRVTRETQRREQAALERAIVEAESQLGDRRRRLAEMDVDAPQHVEAQRGWQRAIAEAAAQLDEEVAAKLSSATAASCSTLLAASRKQATDRLFNVTLALHQDDAARLEALALKEELSVQRQRAVEWASLCELIGSADGKKLRVFAQGLTLDTLLAFANQQLRRLRPRYTLRRKNERMELEMVDHDMGDEVRDCATLSGGETFLVSLALALGLSSLAARNVRVESLFIDEGFGSLDRDALDGALSVLEELQASGQQIGVISHVAELAERVAHRVLVEPTRPGRSVVSVIGPGGGRQSSSKLGASTGLLEEAHV